MKLTGTMLDVAVIVAAGAAGIFMGKKLRPFLREQLIIVLGLIAIVSGLKMAMESGQILVALISIMLGIFMVEVTRFMPKLPMKFTDRGSVSDACIKATVLSLVGPLAILGPVQEGSGHGYSLLLLKSGFDSVSTFLLAASLGPGVVLSFIPVGIFQGILTVAAAGLGSFFTNSVIAGLTSIGGILILTVGLDLLGIKKIKSEGFIMALFVAPVVIGIGTHFGFIGP